MFFFCECDGEFCKLPGSRSRRCFISLFFFFLYIAFIYRLRLAGPRHDEKEALWRFVLTQRSGHVFLARSSGSSWTRSDIFFSLQARVWEFKPTNLRLVSSGRVIRLQLWNESNLQASSFFLNLYTKLYFNNNKLLQRNALRRGKKKCRRTILEGNPTYL